MCRLTDFRVVNPSQLSERDRAELGIGEKLSTTIDRSLAKLEEDTSLIDIIGPRVVLHYVAMKKAELKMLEDMPVEERHVWLMERY